MAREIIHLQERTFSKVRPGSSTSPRSESYLQGGTRQKFREVGNFGLPGKTCTRRPLVFLGQRHGGAVELDTGGAPTCVSFKQFISG